MFAGISGGLLRGGSKFGGNALRGQTSTKRLPKNWHNKGKGVNKIGELNDKARFIPDPNRVLRYQVPDLSGFELQAYVSRRTPNVNIPPPRIPNLKELREKLEKMVVPTRRRDQSRFAQTSTPTETSRQTSAQETASTSSITSS
eukprot:TRINITY_DN7555_c0_g1_i1.p1 TRINITY_DN7555_c0_g1~~TRINITY_DN7555_c0_g1_i1.p1  ORF type:complete len:144 (-),score=13.48 TRINITY_DN7555_c0_g1_i1:29-460(-)